MELRTYLLGMLTGELEAANAELEGAIEAEQESDYGDAMLSMERTHAEGYVEAIGMALKLVQDARLL